MILVGTGKADLRFADGLGLFGFGWGGGRGRNAEPGSGDADTLQARALYIERGNHKLLVVSFDLPSGSRVLHRSILEALRRDGVELTAGQLWVAGTHSHSAPGQYLGNLYDLFGSYPARYRRDVAEEIVRRGLIAARQALLQPQPCHLGVAQRHIWGAGRNRSLRPFLANFEGDPTRWVAELGATAPADATPEERAVDPRLTVVAFVRPAARTPLATWATWCCHPASFHRAAVRAYHRDWPGVAVDTIEKQVPFAMIHQGANGDVTPLPSGERRIVDALSHVRSLGTDIATAWMKALDEAVQAAKEDGAFEVGYRTLVPSKASLPIFEIGQSVVAGSEEYDPGWLTKAFGEARPFPWRGAVQRPKLPAMGPLQWLLRPVPALRPSPEHPMGIVRLGSHLFFASPFEQTTYAARTTEKRLLARWRAVRGETMTASPIGLVGDYAGYVTTTTEFELQNYEGGHTLYGRDQRAVMAEVWSSMIAAGELSVANDAYTGNEPTFRARVDAIVGQLGSDA